MSEAQKALEEYTQSRFLEGEIKGKIKTIRNLLKKNMPLEEALEFAELDKATYDKYISDMQ